jgi:hypothetical protein
MTDSNSSFYDDDKIQSASGVNWYPSKPQEVLHVPDSSHLIDKYPSSTYPPTNKKVELYSDPHPIWTSGLLKYLTSSVWPPSIKKEVKESVRRHRISGVEVRDLPIGHFLFGLGQQGLFATTKFWKFDVLGEYVGRIVGDDVNGHYVAALEDKSHAESLGIDAEHCGNEMRFINSYLNIAFNANVTMRTAYINTFPHIVIVCTQDIEPGDEFLLDYGEAYTQAYLTPKEPPPETPRIDMSVLPGAGDDDECSDTV